MTKVTITVETDEQYTSVSRQSEGATVDQLFAEALSRVADTWHPDDLEYLAHAVGHAFTVRRSGR